MNLTNICHDANDTKFISLNTEFLYIGFWISLKNKYF